MKNNKAFGLCLFFGLNLIAFIAGYFASMWIANLLWRIFFFDVVATVMIWAMSLIVRNSSLYDAYWSLTPGVIVVYLVILLWGQLNVWHYVFLTAFMVWSTRLTVNWCITFDDMTWEDWRYKQYRQLPPLLWHLANFFGIMMIPTLFVFAGFVPVFYLLFVDANALVLIGTAIVAFGVYLEWQADHDMHTFLKKKEKTVCTVGLWKYSRHPNYLGEISVWVGCYVALLACAPQLWYTFGGVVLMIFLFNVISIPMMEKRQLARRPDYAEYKKTVHRLLILPNKK